MLAHIAANIPELACSHEKRCTPHLSGGPRRSGSRSPSNVVMHRRLGRRKHRCVFLASYYLYHAFILYILLSLSNRHQTSSRFSFSYILHTPFRLTGACPGLQSGHFSLRLHPLNNLFIHNRASPFIYLQPRITTLLFILIAQLDMTSLTNSDKTPNF